MEDQVKITVTWMDGEERAYVGYLFHEARDGVLYLKDFGAARGDVQIPLCNVREWRASNQ